MPTVSVIMPVYNAERYVAQAVASLLAQTWQDFELLIIDDGSTDASRSVVDQFGPEKIRLLHPPAHVGVAQARNLGLAAATGEFIAFLDADDVALPQRLARQVAFLRQHPAVGLLGSWAQVIDEAGQPAAAQWAFAPEPGPHLPVNLLFHNRFITSSVMLRAAHLRTPHFAPELNVAEDYDYWARLAHQTGCAILPEKLVQYRAHPAGQGQAHASDMRHHTRQIVRRQLAALGLYPTDDELERHIALGKLQLAEGPAHLRPLADWLGCLHQANARTHVYPARALAGALGHLWFHALSFYCRYGWPVAWAARSKLTLGLPLAQQLRVWAWLAKHLIGWPGPPTSRGISPANN
jgi:glycosyltransferase involved in cell wall biosynthesis